jgi:hypothetical protein
MKRREIEIGPSPVGRNSFFIGIRKKNAVSPFLGGGDSIRWEILTGDLGQ